MSRARDSPAYRHVSDATAECAEPVFGLPVSPDQREKRKKIEVLLDATEGIFEAIECFHEASEVFFEESEAFLEIINRAERGKKIAKTVIVKTPVHHN